MDEIRQRMEQDQVRLDETNLELFFICLAVVFFFYFEQIMED